MARDKTNSSAERSGLIGNEMRSSALDREGAWGGSRTAKRLERGLNIPCAAWVLVAAFGGLSYFDATDAQAAGFSGGGCVTTESTALGPAPALKLVGAAEAPAHPLRLDLGRCMSVLLKATANIRAEYSPEIPLDPSGAALKEDLWLSPVLRLGLEFNSGRRLGELRLSANYEHEVLSEFASVEPAPPGLLYPSQQASRDEEALVLRKAYLRLQYSDSVGIQVGRDTSDWGSGLLENSGERQPEPGSTRFADPRGGDLVTEGRLFFGPMTDFQVSGFAALQFVAHDEYRFGEREVLREMERTDESLQGVLGLALGEPDADGVEIHLKRRVDSAGPREVRRVQHTALSLAGRWGFDLGSSFLLLDGEVVYLQGKNTWLNDEVSNSEQALGSALNLLFSHQRFSAALELVYASGDSHPGDDANTAFHGDPNYELGLILFRQVIGAQTARGVYREAELGAGPSDIRGSGATQGGVTNTISLFPRLGYRVLPGLDAYAGVLFAFAAVSVEDPANTRLASEARGPLDAPPGSYWGTEYDVGLRLRSLLWGSLLTVGVEAGMLDPGSALDSAAPSGAERKSTGLMFGGRGFLNYQL